MTHSNALADVPRNDPTPRAAQSAATRAAGQEPSEPRPGTRLLADQLGTDDPLAHLATRHPEGTRLHRLARGLIQTAIQLDAYYAAARGARRHLGRLRAAQCTSEVLWATARQAEVALERCELTDTALVRLLAAYQDVTNS